MKHLKLHSAEYYLVYLCFETANKWLSSYFVPISILKLNQAEHKLSCAEFLKSFSLLIFTEQTEQSTCKLQYMELQSKVHGAADMQEGSQEHCPVNIEQN